MIKHNDMSLKISLCIAGLLELIISWSISYYTRLLFLSGDVEPNPGPCGISICHINIRGLSSAKLLTIKHQIQNNYSILLPSRETFLSANSTQDLGLGMDITN